MIGNCDHSGFHSGVGKLAGDFQAIRFVVVCDGCGQELREIHVEQYAPQYEASAKASTRPGRRAA